MVWNTDHECPRLRYWDTFQYNAWWKTFLKICFSSFWAMNFMWGLSEESNWKLDCESRSLTGAGQVRYWNNYRAGFNDFKSLVKAGVWNHGLKWVVLNSLTCFLSAAVLTRFSLLPKCVLWFALFFLLKFVFIYI